MDAKFLALDLGAESGRGVVGAWDGTRLTLHDVHRFATGGTRVRDTLHWDALRLLTECKTACTLAANEHRTSLESLGICTWGVDFGLLDERGALLGNPRHYRDRANDGLMTQAFATVPREQIFQRTGIQFMQINTLYQLLALRREGSPLLAAAYSLLFIPDLLHYWLGGAPVSEISIASTSQMLDPFTRTWASDLLERLDLPARILPPLVPPGTPIGTLRPDIADETCVGPLAIVAPGAHDTASAVVAVPVQNPDYAYISSGTWSLVGIETPTPIVNAQTLAANFTNEGGACGTTRLLKNVMGLWLVQECRRAWARQNQHYTYEQLTRLAQEAPAFGPLIDPDDATFLAPDDMTQAIVAFCRRTGQTPPDSVGATVRCCLESLALKYRWVLEQLETLRGRPVNTVHVVGGGTQNRLLCQFTADAAGRTVIAGPTEATAMGNILMQMMGRGHIASLSDARAIVRASVALETYQPTPNWDAWEAAYARLLALLHQTY